MYLFFDAVSTRGCVGLYNLERVLQAEYFFEVGGSEGKELPGMIDYFLQTQNVSYTQIQNIVCVVGPGSFTGIRMVTLVVNTIAYIYPHIFLTPISFFDLYTNYPIVKTSSKKDFFVKWKKDAIIQIVSLEELLSWIEKYSSGEQKIYGNAGQVLLQESISLSESYNPQEVLARIELQKLKKIAPLYVKKPNIS